MRSKQSNLVAVALVLGVAACGSGESGDSRNSADGASNNSTSPMSNSSTSNSSTSNSSTSNSSTSNNGTANNVDNSSNNIDPCDPTGEVAESCASWCDATTWGGEVPTESTDVVIESGQRVVLDCDATAQTLVVEEGGELLASRTETSSLTMHGNLVVRGRLDLGEEGSRLPADVTAEIVFTGMTNEQYQGTPDSAQGSERMPSADTAMDVLETDVGLWVIGSGEFVAAGASKRSWAKLVEGAGPDDAMIEVTDASGWAAGDRVVLTPSAMLDADGSADQFDEVSVESVDGNRVVLSGDISHSHAGCVDCARRSEALNLSRNVVIRSADDSAFAHVMVAEEARAQLDSVELRWLGPAPECGTLPRRAPLYFHQQDDASAGSSLKHAAIWGGQNGFVGIERSHGITIEDVAGYDSERSGFWVGYDNSACGTRCTDRDEAAPKDVVLDQIVAARVAVGQREEGCARISHRMSGISHGGGEGGRLLDSVATGIGVRGSGADIAGFTWGEGGTGRPNDFAFDRNVAHNNNGHGLFIWHNGGNEQPPYEDNAVWSNAKHGIHWGAYNNRYVLQNFTAVDNGVASIGVKAVPRDDRPRLDGGTVDDIRVLSYVLVQDRANRLKDLTFTGEEPVGVTQIEDPCQSGDPNDADDPDCLRVWLRFENPVFPSGMVPFVFGDSINKHAVWEVRGFTHPDYPELPSDFDLHRRDNEVAGGSYHEEFDAWLVPK